MISARDFWSYLKIRGFIFFSGVPCSILKEVLKEAINDPQIRYVPAVRENAALGLASGAYLTGKQSGILIQNSGLGNIMNALTSFNLIYKVPVLMFVTWRGFAGKDAPEHIIMGEKTLSLLNELKIPNRILTEDFKGDIDWALKMMREDSVPTAIILKNGLIK